MENKKPYHHIENGKFRNPEGSPERDSKVKWSYKIFNEERKKLKIDYPSDHVVPSKKVIRDLNLVIPNEQEVGPIIEIFHKYGKKLITQSEAVDVFEDKETIGDGLKSVTFSLIFQDPSKTLEDKDVNPIIDEIIRVAEKTFNAKLRV